MGSQRVEHNWVSIHSQLTCFIGNRKVTGPFTRVVFLPCLCLCQSPASLRKINPAAIVLQVHTWLLLTSQHLENIRIYYFQLFMNLGWFWLALILRRAHNTKNIRPPSLKTLRWYIGRIIQTSSNVCTLWCVLSFSVSSCDKANVRFPQPPKQKHLLWESESILKINLD